MAERILGVDPGSRRTGWGLLAGSPSHPTLIGCGMIRLPPTLPFPARLARLQHELEALVSEWRPTAAAVESPYHGANARSSLQLAHARGVILAVLSAAGLDVVEYPPATVKKAVTGNGQADKPQVARMIAALLRVRDLETGDDVTDALGVALCHLSSRGFVRRVARVSEP